MNRSSAKVGIALVLPGAVSRGAYEAGVLGVLAEKEIKIKRIVATSSGALNGVAYAAGIRRGQEREMAASLTHNWIEHGTWRDSLALKPSSWLKGRGFSGNGGLLSMLRELVTPCPASAAKQEIELRIVVAAINGVKGSIGTTPATTYEKVLSFSGVDFDTQEGLERIFQCASAACAFPGLYAAVDLPGLGPCFDGGTVNNTPIAYALEEGDIDRVIVPIPSPALLGPPGLPYGAGLAKHMIEVLVNERMFRDLRDAQMINKRVEVLDALVDEGVLTSAQLEAVKRALPYRTVGVVEIRPAKQLDGTLFSGFMSRKARVEFIRQGREAAEACLGRSLE
jgi:NTE family protein